MNCWEKLICILKREKPPTDYCVCECENVDWEVCDKNCVRKKEENVYGK